MLACSCNYDSDGWWYYHPHDFTILQTKRRRRCCSCASQIEIGATCVELERYRSPNTDIEERIYGDEVPMASWWLCEWCGEMFFNLDALGYCYWAGDSLIDNLMEYWELTGFTPEVKNQRDIQSDP